MLIRASRIEPKLSRVPLAAPPTPCAIGHFGTISVRSLDWRLSYGFKSGAGFRNTGKRLRVLDCISKVHQEGL